MKKIPVFLLLSALAATPAVADTVYVTATCSNVTATADCPGKINPDLNSSGTPVYADLLAGLTTAVSAKPDGPATPGARYISSLTTFSNTTPDNPGITINPDLGVAGGVYRLYHIFSSAAGNVNTNAVLGVTNLSGCTLSFSQTAKFQTSYGTSVSGKNVYQFLGYVTNNADALSPKIGFYYLSGYIGSAGAGFRFLVDTFKFVLDNPCLDVPVVGVTGPLAANLGSVVVTGVTNTATQITVYQDSGSGMLPIGSLTSGIVNGNNSVPVSGLVLGARVAATQTVNGHEGCPPTAGILVGGGANPPVRICLSIRETPSTGPAGTPGVTTNSNIHFLGASAVSGGAPTDSMIIYPSNDWQTVTFTARSGIATPAHAAGAAANIVGSGYAANDSVAVQVFAYQATPLTGVTVYSPVGAQTAAVTSNDVFVVNWTWDAVPGADGYRLLRNVNGAGYNEFVDMAGANNFTDENNAWSGGNTVTPVLAQTLPSISWNPNTTIHNNIATTWGILESLAITPADDTDTGPYDLYIDNIQNGATVFQTFESAPAGTTDYTFRAPSYSGSTSGNILAAPNVGMVVNNAADTGTKSFRVQFQWQVLNKWLRLTTSGVNNPQVDLDYPISFRLLLQPKGAPLPTPPPAPTLLISNQGGKKVLNWIGGHRVQTSVNVAGPYTNGIQVLNTNMWTNITLGGYLAPWTNPYTEPTRFFRLKD
jgi:hypothetical protein